MQEKMINELGINPIDKEVAIVYEGEAQEHPDEFFEVHYEVNFVPSVPCLTATVPCRRKESLK